MQLSGTAQSVRSHYSATGKYQNIFPAVLWYHKAVKYAKYVFFGKYTFMWRVW